MSTATTEITQVPQGTWAVDPVHSRVEFEVEHNGALPFRGGFSDYEARLLADERGELAVEGAARVDSITADGDLGAHLRSPEFFDVERHPEITFRSERVELGEEGELAVEGELTIRGTARPVLARGRTGEPGVNLGGQAMLGVSLEATVDRHDFGLGWNMELPNGKKVLGDEVRLLVTLELVEGGG